MSREQIEELIFAMHKPRIEVTISDGEKTPANESPLPDGRKGSSG